MHIIIGDFAPNASLFQSSLFIYCFCSVCNTNAGSCVEQFTNKNILEITHVITFTELILSLIMNCTIFDIIDLVVVTFVWKYNSSFICLINVL